MTVRASASPGKTGLSRTDTLDAHQGEPRQSCCWFVGHVAACCAGGYLVAVLECSVWTCGPAGMAGGDVPGNGIRGTPKVLS